MYNACLTPADLHFIKQLSLLQFILFLLIHLIRVAFLDQQELLSHLVVDTVHLVAHRHEFRADMVEKLYLKEIKITPTVRNILGPPSCALSSLIHLLDIALLKPILPKGSFCTQKRTSRLIKSPVQVLAVQVLQHQRNWYNRKLVAYWLCTCNVMSV